MKYRYGFIAVALIATLVTAVARKVSAPAGWPDNDDKSSLKFSHAHHVTELGAACIDCHKGASTSTKASDNLRSNMKAASDVMKNRSTTHARTVIRTPRTCTPRLHRSAISRSPTSSI